MKCPECNAKIRKGSKFCSKCGQNLEEICPQCGEPIRYIDNFCSNCGTKVKEAMSNINLENEYLYTEGKKYYEGNGVEQDYKKAFKYFSKAAKQGNENAKSILNKLYSTNQEYYEQEQEYGKKQESEKHSNADIIVHTVHIGLHILKHIIG